MRDGQSRLYHGNPPHFVILIAHRNAPARSFSLALTRPWVRKETLAWVGSPSASARSNAPRRDFGSLFQKRPPAGRLGEGSFEDAHPSSRGCRVVLARTMRHPREDQVGPPEDRRGPPEDASLSSRGPNGSSGGLRWSSGGYPMVLGRPELVLGRTRTVLARIRTVLGRTTTPPREEELGPREEPVGPHEDAGGPREDRPRPSLAWANPRHEPAPRVARSGVSFRGPLPSGRGAAVAWSPGLGPLGHKDACRPHDP